MTVTLSKRRLAAGLAAVCLAAGPAFGQFVAFNSYQPTAQPTQPAAQPQYTTPPQQAPAAQYTAPPQYATATPPAYAAPPQSGAIYTPPQAVAATPAYQPTATSTPTAAAYAPAGPTQAAASPVNVTPPTGAAYQPSYQYAPSQAAAPGYPRVAQAAELPAPAEAAPAQPVTPTPAEATTAMPYDGGYQSVDSYQQPTPSYATPATATAGCADGSCGAGSQHVMTAAPTAGYDYGAACGVGYGPQACAPSCGPVCAPACRPKRQWFAGIYGLYMARDNPGKAVSAFRVEDETAIVTPYYPPGTVDFLTTSEAEVDGQWGGEVRFGSTFGCPDACGCGRPFAWEIGYWALGEDESAASSTIDVPLSAGADPRIYGGMNYAGLEYDRDGAGGGTWAYRPLNDYYDYQLPVENAAPDDIRVVGVRVRQSFEVQNLELNFWRFGHPAAAPSLCGGCGGGACGVNACGGGACGVSSCGSCRPPRRFFINGLAGIRYFRTDEFWQNAIQFTQVDGTGTPTAGEPTAYTGFPTDDDNVLFHDIDVDNQLVGFQLGCSMNWLVGCRWNFFCDSNFGVYGNDVDVYQRIYSGGGGDVRFVGDATNAAVRARSQDVAFLGEWRLGGGYQISCNCRFTAAYRLIAVSGIALGVEQIPASFSNAELLTHVDNNDSLVLHGLQTGVEWKY